MMPPNSNRDEDEMIKRERVFDGSGTSERQGAELHALGFATITTGQDCGFYGQWANPTTRTIVAFTEGDVTRTQCETVEEFTTEMRRIAAWHGEDDWIGIDPKDQNMREAFACLDLTSLLIRSRSGETSSECRNEGRNQEAT